MNALIKVIKFVCLPNVQYLCEIKMKNLMKKLYLLLLLFSILISSCKTQKEVVYFQNIDEVIKDNQDLFTSPKIQTGDLLSINVSSYNMESTIPFNLTITANSPGSNQNIRGQQQAQSYLVNSDGNIDFPVLGRINVENKSGQEISSMLQEKIKKYVKEPIVTVKLLNFKFTVLGEVRNPGVFETQNEKVTILEALGKAKDLTLYGRRDSVMLIRNENNKFSKHFIDLKSASFIDSSYYYLRQNDVIYVQPNKTKTKESKVTPFNSLMISAAAVAIALITLIAK